MKTVTLKIISCYTCPYYRRLIDRDTGIDWCREVGRKLEGLTLYDSDSPIPSWCPLEERDDRQV